MPLHIVDVIIRSLEKKNLHQQNDIFGTFAFSNCQKAKVPKMSFCWCKIFFLLMIELWHPRYVEASKTSKEHVYVHFSYFWPSSTTLWPIMYDIEKSWKMWFWPKIITFFQGSKWAENVKYYSKMALWASKNHFLQNFDITT